MPLDGHRSARAIVAPASCYFRWGGGRSPRSVRRRRSLVLDAAKDELFGAADDSGQRTSAKRACMAARLAVAVVHIRCRAPRGLRSAPKLQRGRSDRALAPQVNAAFHLHGALYKRAANGAEHGSGA